MIRCADGAEGSLVGRAIDARMNQRALKKVFAVLLVFLGGFVIVREGSKVFLKPAKEAVVSASEGPRRNSLIDCGLRETV
jgi:hypothetical protein